MTRDGTGGPRFRAGTQRRARCATASGAAPIIGIVNGGWFELRTVLRTVLVVVVVVLTLYLIYLLRRPLTWIVIAMILAIAMSGPVNLLSRWVPRKLAIFLAYLALVLVPIGIGIVFVPPIVDSGNQLANNLPEYARDVREFIEERPQLRKLERDYEIGTKLQEQAAKLPDKLGGAAGTLRDIGVGVVNSIFAGITILILSVFMVSNGRRWAARLVAAQPPERAPRLERALNRMATAIGNYVGGALAQAFVAGLTTYIVLIILGVPFAAPLAVLTALFDLIPLVGATIGAIVVGLVTLFTDFPTATIIWAIWAVVYQQVENSVIQPQIQRRAVDVHPFVVLVSVLFGSTLFGVMGALLAIPIAASAQIAVREYLAYRREARETQIQPPDAELGEAWV
jgi:predicted PurR-regulated permease PerM